jgi:hypothetical protein
LALSYHPPFSAIALDYFIFDPVKTLKFQQIRHKIILSIYPSAFYFFVHRLMVRQIEKPSYTTFPFLILVEKESGIILDSLSYTINRFVNLLLSVKETEYE